MGLTLRNMSSKTVTLKRGMAVAHFSAAYEVPSKLVPRIITKASSVNTHLSVHPGMGVEIGRKPVNPDAPQVHTHSTPGRLDKHFGKLDLYEAQAWTDQE